MTYTEMVKRIQAKYRRLNIDHPTPLVEGRDRDQRVLWTASPARGNRVMFLTKLQNEALKVNAGRLNGLTENSILAVYPPTGPIATERLLGNVILTSVGATESDVAGWDEVKAADFQKDQYKPLTKECEGGERCEPVFLAYGDLKLKVAVSTDDDKGHEARSGSPAQGPEGSGSVVSRGQAVRCRRGDGSTKPNGWYGQPAMARSTSSAGRV